MGGCFIAHRVKEDVEPAYSGSGHGKERRNPGFGWQKETDSEAGTRRNRRRAAERGTMCKKKREHALNVHPECSRCYIVLIVIFLSTELKLAL